MGTAAGDLAFPKGKENLASVLKRYKRRLSNKPVGNQELAGISGLRKLMLSASSPLSSCNALFSLYDLIALKMIIKIKEDECEWLEEDNHIPIKNFLILIALVEIIVIIIGSIKT
uniref:Uncharacterized protein n=1 Tax=Solanum lycopersicum TaxID=4081 RepID=A0A3Q7HXM0_SOLLC